jgi:beta-phosphoglucomutase
MGAPEAVIFDLDGTLVDSLEANYKSFRDVLKEEYGLEMTLGEFKPLFGGFAAAIFEEYLRGKVVEAADYKRLVDGKQRAFAGKYARDVRALPGAVRIVAQLRRAGIKVAVASNSPRRNVVLMLAASGLAGLFDAVVAADEISRPKPDPEIFLKAAQMLAAEPRNCAVVEDSIYGIRAARRAGMATVAVTTGGAKKADLEAEKPGLTVESLEDVTLASLRVP